MAQNEVKQPEVKQPEVKEPEGGLEAKAKKQYGPDAEILSVGKSTIVVSYAKRVKGDDGKEASARVVEKVPRP